METNQKGTMLLTLCRSADVHYLNLAATMIRELPRVLRVRVDFETRRLEILYQDAPVGLAREIHTALLTADNEMSALRAHSTIAGGMAKLKTITRGPTATGIRQRAQEIYRAGGGQFGRE